MKRRTALLYTLAVLGLLFALPAFAKEIPQIPWQKWSPEIFEKAKAERKLVILDLEARWCHWCHVMEDVVYSNETVREVITDNYIAVRADQAKHSDLAKRYGDWGWPATVVFNAEGQELGKYRGFIRVRNMIGELAYYTTNRVPEGPATKPVAPAQSLFLSEAQRKAILETYAVTWDADFGGWGKVLKFIHADTLQYALHKARQGDAEARDKAKKTLDAALNIMDPVWGGIYQYSDKQDWSSPHFEKIMSYQRDVLKLYSEAYALFGDQKYLNAARKTRDYLKNHLTSQDGAFFASQDADIDLETTGAKFYALDDTGRKGFGKAPGVDTGTFALENGWAVSGLMALYQVDADPEILADAERAARWVLANRSRGDGGFNHSQNDPQGPFLGDTLAMGQAFLALHKATGHREWLNHAAKAAAFVEQKFRHRSGGYFASPVPANATGIFTEPVRNIEENIDLGRFANLLSHFTGDQEHRELAENTMRYLASPAITSQRRFLLGILLLDHEMSVDPAHVTVVGSKKDEKAERLHTVARALPLSYYRLDWWDPAEGPLPNADVTYPELGEPAAFACVNEICSLPILKRDELLQTVKRFQRLRKPLLRGG